MTVQIALAITVQTTGTNFNAIDSTEASFSSLRDGTSSSARLVPACSRPHRSCRRTPNRRSHRSRECAASFQRSWPLQPSAAGGY